MNADLSKAVSLRLSLAGSLRQNDMMAGGNTLGGSTGAVSRTALDYAPYEMPEDDPAFDQEAKTTVFSWLNDYVDLADDKTFNASFCVIISVPVVTSIPMNVNAGMVWSCIRV